MPWIHDPTAVVVCEGRVLRPEEPLLPAAVPGVLRGEGIFETFLVEDGVPDPFLPRHDARLRTSARLLGLDLEDRGLAEEWPALRPHVGPGPWRARYTVLRGGGGSLLRFWTAGPANPPPREVTLQLARVRRDPGDPLAAAKLVSRAQAQWARRQAEAAGAWDALLPTVEGDLAECTTSNLLLWTGRELRTPSLDRGILAGVTRGALLEAARAAGIPARETRILPEDAAGASELMVSNSVIGVVPVRRLLGLREDFPGAEGPFCRRLQGLYRQFREGLRDRASDRA